jgi:hypothetical protein
MAFRIPGERGVTWWARAPSIEHLTSYVQGVDELYTPDGWRRVYASTVSADFFSVFASTPVAGRYFETSDEDTEPVGAAVISRRLWESYGAGSPGIVGHDVHLGGRTYRVVGVAPDDLDYPALTDVWLAGLVGGVSARNVRHTSKQLISTGPWGGWVVRLRSGASPLDAQRELLALLAELNQRQAPSRRTFGDTVVVMPLRGVVAQSAGPTLRAWLIGSLVLLAIAAIHGELVLKGRSPARLRDVATLWASTAAASLFMLALAVAVIYSDAGRFITAVRPDSSLAVITIITALVLATLSVAAVCPGAVTALRHRAAQRA